jgi:hypothetical protein
VARRAPDAGARGAWLFAVVALAVGLGFVVWLLSSMVTPHTASVPTPSASPSASPRPVPSPSPALALTGDRPGVIGQASSRPGEVTSAPASGGLTGPELVVEFPRESEVLVSRTINAFGRAPAGATVRATRSDGTAVEASARADGLWIVRIELAAGVNELRFEVLGVPGSSLSLAVYHQPR